MDVEFALLKLEQDDTPDQFTLAEIINMEILFKKKSAESIDQEFCEKLAAKFNRSTHRSEKPYIKWEQVQSWFHEKQKNKVTTSTTCKNKVTSSKAAVVKPRIKVPTISAYEASIELSNLIFEARSAKDYAWFDVGSFLGYRVNSSGELLVRVRFAGFGKEEDEWVSLKNAVRERSIPLEHSECDKVKVGDLVLCYRESEHHALYSDAHVVEIERGIHDSDACTCIFVVRYDRDNFEEKVPVGKLCCRPTKPVSGGIVDSKLNSDVAEVVAAPMVN